LKQQSAGRRVASLRHIFLIASQPVFFFLNATCLAGKQQIPIVLSLVCTDGDSNPWSTALKVSTQTIHHQWGFQVENVHIVYYHIYLTVVNKRREYWRDNPEKLATKGTQNEEKQSKNTTQYVLDTAKRKQRK